MKLGLFHVREGGPYTGEKDLKANFEKSKKINLTGDNGEGKTKALELFRVIVGSLGGEEIINDLVNRDSEKLDAELPFVGNDRKNYVIRLTKSKFYVRQEGGTKDEPSPKSFIQQHLGMVAADPMAIKNASVDDIIKWLASFTKKGADVFKKEMKKLRDEIRDKENDRASYNKEAKARRVLLQSAGFADNEGQIIEEKWTEAEKTFAKKLDISELSKKLSTAGAKSDKFVENETKVAGQKTRKTQIEAQIAALQQELTQVDENIKIGEDWLEKNKAAKKEYDTIKKEYDNAAGFAQQYEAWQTVKRYKSEMDKYEDDAIAVNGEIDELKEKKQKKQWEIIPDVKGVELVMPDDEDGREEGFYLNKFNSRQLSATEFLVAIVNILRKLGCKILVLDDTATYGSDFIAQLEKLSKEGWYILTAEMKRNQELEIEYA